MSKFIVGHKVGKACIECGEDHIACLDFHHPNKDKEGVFSRGIKDWSVKRIQAEIKKCIILCSNCHRKLHWKERQIGATREI